MSTFLKRVFAYMFGAVALSAVTSYVTLRWGAALLFTETGMSPLFYIAMFGGLGLSIFAQARAFSMRAEVGAVLLGIYAVLMGFVMTPLIALSPLSYRRFSSRRLCSDAWRCSDTRR